MPVKRRPGVVQVDKGWRDWSEINTAIFDPARIGIKEMKQVLQQAGTYRETLPPSGAEQKSK